MSRSPVFLEACPASVVAAALRAPVASALCAPASSLAVAAPAVASPAVASAAAVVCGTFPKAWVDTDVHIDIPVNVKGPCESGPFQFHNVSPTSHFPVAIGEADDAAHAVF